MFKLAESLKERIVELLEEKRLENFEQVSFSIEQTFLKRSKTNYEIVIQDPNNLVFDVREGKNEGWFLYVYSIHSFQEESNDFKAQSLITIKGVGPLEDGLEIHNTLVSEFNRY